MFTGWKASTSFSGGIAAYKACEIVSYLVREGASSYLDWVIPALLTYDTRYDIQVVSTGTLVEKEVEKQIQEFLGLEQRIKEVYASDDELYRELEASFAKTYPHEASSVGKNK